MRWRVAVVISVTATAAALGRARSPDPSAPPTERLASPQTRVPGEYLITLSAKADVGAIADTYGRFGLERTQDLGRGIFLVTLRVDPGPAKMEELQKQDTRIKNVQPNFVYRGAN
jgi:hypothetical protein